MGEPNWATQFTSTRTAADVLRAVLIALLVLASGGWVTAAGAHEVHSPYDYDGTAEFASRLNPRSSVDAPDQVDLLATAEVNGIAHRYDPRS